MLSLYNTLHHKKEELKPLKKGKVGLYTCGPTVYNYAHIGNLRTYVFEDILKRSLLFLGYKVKHVMNITDVGHLTSDADTGEDKMEKGAKREGKSAWDIARFYTEAFEHDIAELNILPPDIYCRATDYITEQIKLVEKLEKKGYTYITSDGVYFDTAKFPDYGQMANLKNQNLQAGLRVDMGDKKNPTDFALWKFSVPHNETSSLISPLKGGENEIDSPLPPSYKEGDNAQYPPLAKRGTAGLAAGRGESRRQMEWESPWGVGFPGWHIECSAMSMKFLGENFDIHCGGIDHIPVHHTNEIAQSEAATGKPLANYWLHGEYLLTENDRMAKSGGNFLTLAVLKEKDFSPLAYRYFLLQTHYRKQLNFSWDALKAAENGLKHFWVSAVFETNNKGDKALEKKFKERLEDDLDLPGAMALIWSAFKEKTISLKQLEKFDDVLGLGIKEAVQQAKNELEQKLPPEIQKLADERQTVRQNKDWAKSDELREKIEKFGYIVKDTAGKTQISKK